MQKADLGFAVTRKQLSGLEILIAFDEGPERNGLVTALRAAHVGRIHHATSRDDFFDKAVHAQPAAAFVSFAFKGKPTLELLKGIREGGGDINRELPFIVASSRPSAKLARMALNAGAHEFLVLPTTVATLSALLHRAITGSRPFVGEGDYYGPCRRRREAPSYHGPERRMLSWGGYPQSNGGG